MALKKQKHRIVDWVVPTRRNQHHPHLVRSYGLTLCAVLLLLSQFLGRAGAAHSTVLGYATNINVADLYNLANHDRSTHGLPALHLNTQLNQAAQTCARYMFKHNYWAHVAPDGTQPWIFISQAGYTYSYAGQNLAKDFNTSAAVEAAWMGSAEHRANILNTHYVDAGFAVMNGTLVGGQTTLVVAFYANHPSSHTTSTGQVKAQSTNVPPPQQPTIHQSKSPPTRHPVSDKRAVAVKETAAGPVAVAVLSEAGPIVSPQTIWSNLSWYGWVAIGLLVSLVLVNTLRHIAYLRHHRYHHRRIWHTSHALWQAGLITVAVSIVLIGRIGVIQ